jgi:thiamine biosynthesis lipoprotein ApbE
MAFSDVVEVSVVAGDGMTADALATTVRVMGVRGAGAVLRRFRASLVGSR